MVGFSEFVICLHRSKVYLRYKVGELTTGSLEKMFSMCCMDAVYSRLFTNDILLQQQGGSDAPYCDKKKRKISSSATLHWNWSFVYLKL